MKKLLILGAGHFQMPAIRKARDMGFFVITCSNIVNDPGIAISDRHYQASTTDLERILQIASKEHIDGIMTIASEVAAITVAHVSNKLGLVGYPLESAKIISNKYALRAFLTDRNLSSISFGKARSYEEAEQIFERLTKPVMVKPLSSSGSKGITKVGEHQDLAKAFETAVAIKSPGDSSVIIEEFVSGTEIGGEALIWKGEIVFSVITRKYLTRRHVPFGHLLPNTIDPEMAAKVRTTLNQVVKYLDLEYGPLNFDIILHENEVFIIELGGRLGGNCLPDLMYRHTGTDTLGIVINMAMGELEKPAISADKIPVAAYIFHNEVGGVLQQDIAKEIHRSFIKLAILDYSINAQVGDSINAFNSGSAQLGHMVFGASTEQALLDLFEKTIAHKWIHLYEKN